MTAQREWFEKDYYKVLGVAESATDKDITRAYRKLAKEHHPDANPGSEERFKEISAAYDVLGDAEKRKEYDEVRKMGPMAGGFGQGGGFGTGVFNASDFEDFDFGDVFSSLFDQARRSRGPLRGKDMEAVLHLTFREAVKGGTKELRLSGGGPTKVRIPSGVEDGQRIRLKGHGAPGEVGAEAGDLYVVCRVDTDGRFARDGNNLLTATAVSFVDAVLGAVVTVPTLDAPVTVKIPAGTQPGTKLRIKGRGVPGHSHRPPGDLLVRVDVTIPKSLSEDQRVALSAFKDVSPGSL